MAAAVRVLSVVGTRPNFMKIGPVVRALAGQPEFEHVLVHTGQHYDEAMSSVFFRELGLPEPDVYLGIGSGSHTAQTARVMTGLEQVLHDRRPDVVLVPGDVNSTLAAALAAKQSGFRVGHIEAGLRSFDRTMPEELNRVLTDQLSDLLFIHSPEARTHLLAERRPAEAIHAVGNTMIDTLVGLQAAIAQRDSVTALGLPARGYVLVTLHRPALVDGAQLPATLMALERLAETFEVVFPVHPRTRARIDALSVKPADARLHLVPPLGYLDFMALLQSAAGVLTDSGGVQEESTYLGVPCFTLRDNTERPITVELGTNRLLGLAPERIGEIPAMLAGDRATERRIPEGWDGRAADRIVAVLAQELG
jgi:UDP-N-acetylglucosamine 2-epimerase (non-hydrolysing)